MEIDSSLVAEAAQKLQLSVPGILNVLHLIIKDECTIPFIVRYRKERTGGMDEVAVRQIIDTYTECQEREKRRHYILDALAKQEALTPELEESVLKATTIQQLEDLYGPFKSKKKTKAQLARERGLLPLAEIILSSEFHSLSIDELETKKATAFVPGLLQDLTTTAQAMQGAADIIIEKFAHQQNIKEQLRMAYWKEAVIVSTKKEDAEQIKDHQKYQDFFEHKEPIKALRQPKSTHRYLAMRRGQKAKVLKFEIEHDPHYALGLIATEFYPGLRDRGHETHHEFLQKCAEKAYNYYIHPSLDLEIKSELKALADGAAINVFGKNLKDLLLAPYLGPKKVMGVDPGVRTGCKIVVIDSTGKLLIDQVIFPFAPQNDVVGSKKIINLLFDHFKIEYVAIGNGTHGRETLAFFKENFEAVKSGQIKVTSISEAGASIYSASDLAREEFPDKDATVRGAISIARRFQDPLAELVKIDPKSIGVGQYQHDVNQSHLKKSLTEVVESCVNYVGVDINTASAPLLSFISGMNKSLSKSLVQFREEKGGLSSREQLLNVPRFTPKIFQQCAGFLRIYGGENPLDATFIHPEQYPLLQDWAKSHGKDLKQLLADSTLCEELQNDSEIRAKIGEMSLEDIANSLRAPSQDPRQAFESMEFTPGLNSLDDVKVGQIIKGVVTNITMFGAFVDVGIKEQGLIHISELSDRYVENAFDHLQIGQELQVRVLGVDLERRRLGLSCRPLAAAHEGASNPQRSRPRPQPGRDAEGSRADGARGRNDRGGQDRFQDRSNSRRPSDSGQMQNQTPHQSPGQGQGQNNQGQKGKEKRPREIANRPFSILKNFKV